MFQLLFKKTLDRLSPHLPIRLKVIHADQTIQNVGRTDSNDEVCLVIKSPASYRKILFDPSLGFGDSYAMGLLDVPGKNNLYLFLRAVSQVRTIYQPTLLKSLLAILHPSFNVPNNDITNSQENVRRHYDAHDEIIRLITGREHIYSCAFFFRPGLTLDQAQEAKLEYLLRKTCPAPGLSLLDIGCGYGALVRRAAEKFGMKAYGTTLSAEQKRVALDRIRKVGLGERCFVSVSDYRMIKSRYDRIISVGMFEHVGRRNWPIFFQSVAEALAKNGVFVLHSICVNARSRQDRFISKRIFPGFELPMFDDCVKHAADAGLQLRHVENLQDHYRQTCLCWLANLQKMKAEITRKFGEFRYRQFEVYLAGGAASFSVPDEMQLGQFVFTNGQFPWPANTGFMTDWLTAHLP
ncbi:MAG: cyclopropane-fatty-acyl-phospholipid synthase family protein [bacterium]|nr:cyclopropane-fatty-acyl-phospholipid synthase family protein [bacterium]